MSRSAAYETAQNFAQALHRMVRPNLVQAHETAQNLARAVTLDDFRAFANDIRNRPELCSGVLGHPGSRQRAAYETAQDFARAFHATNQTVGRAAYETAQDFARMFGYRALDQHRVAYEAAQNSAQALASRFFSVSRQICTHHRYVPPTSGTCTAIGCRCWRRGGSRCRWAHRRVARFRVRRRNPAGQARGLLPRVAHRR